MNSKNEELTRLTTEQVSRIAYPIHYWTPKSGVVLAGTGFIFRIDQAVFLITAAHVADLLSGKPTVFPNDNKSLGQVLSWWRTKGNGEDQIDLAAAKLSDAVVEKINSYATILDLNTIDPLPTINPKSPLAFAGFPHALNPKKATELRQFVFVGRKVAHTKLPYELHYKPATHFCLKYEDKNSQSAVSRNDRFPEPIGMSGCPVWRVSDIALGENRLDFDGLIGIGIEYHKNHRLLAAVHIAVLFKLLRYGWPDLTKELPIAKPVPALSKTKLLTLNPYGFGRGEAMQAITASSSDQATSWISPDDLLDRPDDGTFITVPIGKQRSGLELDVNARSSASQNVISWLKSLSFSLEEVNQTLSNPSQTVHLYPAHLNPSKQSDSGLSLFAKSYRDRRGDSFTNLVHATRIRDALLVTKAYRLFHSDFSVGEDTSPLEALQLMTERFGASFRIFDTEWSNLYVDREFAARDRGLPPRQNVVLAVNPGLWFEVMPKGKNIDASVLMDRYENTFHVAVAYFMCLDPYIEYLRWHNLDANFPTVQTKESILFSPS